MPEDASTVPSAMDELHRAEQLLTLALRATVVGHGDCAPLQGAYARTLGAAGDDARQAHFVFIRCLALNGRRRLSVHLPRCRAVSADELAILEVIALAQRPAQHERLLTRLGDLLEAAPTATTVQVAAWLGQILADAGRLLPLRTFDGLSAPVPRPGLSTSLH
jgi:hypothetical protein